MSRPQRFLFGLFLISCWLSAPLSAASIRGMLTDNGVPAPNVKVAAIDSQKKQLPPTYTNREGLYFLRGIERSQTHALRVWIEEDRSVDIPIVASVKPANDLPPIDISATVASGNEQEIKPQEIDSFLKTYYQLYQKGDIDTLATMYADVVDYYEQGTRSRELVMVDKKQYVKYITKRRYTLKKFDVFDTLIPSEKGVRFTFTFLVGPLKRPMTKPSSSTEVWTLRRIKGRIQIVRCRSDRMG